MPRTDMNRSKKERKLEFGLIEVLKITIKDGKKKNQKISGHTESVVKKC